MHNRADRSTQDRRRPSPALREKVRAKRGVDVGIEVPMQREARQRGRAFSDERTSSPLAQVGKSGADGLQFEKERWQETHPNRESDFC